MSADFVSWFSGGGGADIGAQMAGYTLVAANEYDPDIAAVYIGNLGDHIRVGDVLDQDPRDYPDCDLFHASPPCPNFSVANVGGEETPHDIALADKVAEFIRLKRPRAFTLENVPAYLKSRSYKIILKAVSDGGYMYDARIINSADFGVPQTRKRLFIRAVQGLLRPLPAPLPWVGWYEAIADLIDTLPESRFAPWQLKRLAANEEKGHRTAESVFVGGGNKSQSFLDFAIENRPSIPGLREADEPMLTIPADAATTQGGRAFIISAANVESAERDRMAHEPTHTIRASVNEVMPKAFLVESRNSHQERGDGLRSDEEPATTVTTDDRPSHRPTGVILNRNQSGRDDFFRQEIQPSYAVTAGDLGRRQAVLMPNANTSSGVQRDGHEPSPTVGNVARVGNQPRAWLEQGRVVKMTPRALARFQSFPDWYKLPEKNRLACRIIGNAVPPLMYAAIAESLKE